jgi:8-oxo-dGTP pyrophosphatase MutT (NUDIX family)
MPSASPDGSGFRHVEDRLIHQGKVVAFYEGTFQAPDGHHFVRDVVRHPGAVSVVPVDGDEVVLVRQYRAPIDALMLEIPAGKRDVDGEDPALTAHRELAEEIGMAAGGLELLVTMHHSPGFCDELQLIYLATDLTSVDQALDGIEEQHLTIERLVFDEAVAACYDGTITDAKSIVGILAAARRLGR